MGRFTRAIGLARVTTNLVYNIKMADLAAMDGGPIGNGARGSKQGHRIGVSSAPATLPLYVSAACSLQRRSPKSALIEVSSRLIGGRTPGVAWTRGRIGG